MVPAFAGRTMEQRRVPRNSAIENYRANPSFPLWLYHPCSVSGGRQIGPVLA
jgi:hypothetical protein